MCLARKEMALVICGTPHMMVFSVFVSKSWLKEISCFWLEIQLQNQAWFYPALPYILSFL